MNRRTWRYLAAQSALIAAAALSNTAWAGVPSFSQTPMLASEDDFCIGKEDGIYEHPDCRVHYSCKKGNASVVSCPDGQVFDSYKNVADNPGKSYCSPPASARHSDCSELLGPKSQ